MSFNDSLSHAFPKYILPLFFKYLLRNLPYYFVIWSTLWSIGNYIMAKAIINTFAHFSFIIKSIHSVNLLFSIVNTAKYIVWLMLVLALLWLRFPLVTHSQNSVTNVENPSIGELVQQLKSGSIHKLVLMLLIPLVALIHLLLQLLFLF